MNITPLEISQKEVDQQVSKFMEPLKSSAVEWRAAMKGIKQNDIFTTNGT